MPTETLINAINKPLGTVHFPYSIEAEHSVLGALLNNFERMTDVCELLSSESFYSERNRELFSILLAFFGAGAVCDPVTVLNAAIARKVFDSENEGQRFLLSLMENVPTTSNIASYAKIVAEKHTLRQLAQVSTEILDEIAESDSSSDLVLDSAEQKIFNLRQGRDIVGLTPLNTILYDVYDHLGKISGPEKDKYVGAKSGFTLLDSITTGLNKSDLILLGARPGMGKTSFALNIASNVAKRAENSVCVFSLEMSKEQLASRLLSSEAQVDSHRMRSGYLENSDWDKLQTALDRMFGYNMLIDDTAGINVQQMKAKLRRVKNLGLVVIDYLQLMNSTLKTDNRVVIISEITRNLKILAKELAVPVILLSQLSRGVESRTDKRPMLSDLRESGSIEQDADIVMFLYRDAYYNKEDGSQGDANQCECIVAKNRHGETGSVPLAWDGRYTRFMSLQN